MYVGSVAVAHRMPSKPDDAVDVADKSLVETLVVAAAAAFFLLARSSGLCAISNSIKQ